ncbi:MAG: helix-turn-helix transcriptional regulator [Acholeplasmatales bacterium]|nr:helix-turn-helix transcriptional regulator [Acholeplasmatales bacterium]
MSKAKEYKKIIEENQNKCANPHIGVIIKRRRKDLNMTLEDVTKGICCVSYLSKLEHGTIVPKKYVLNEVLDRLNMKEENLRSKNEYIDIIQKCLIEIYYGNFDVIYEYFENISDVESIHYTDIIKAIYHLVVGNLNESEKFINKALVVKQDFAEEELTACILVSALIAEEKHKYKEALDIIKTIEYTYINNIEVEKLKAITLCRIYLMLGMYLSLSNALIIYEDLCMKTIDYGGLVEAKEQFGLSLAYNNEEKAALNICELVKRVLDKDSADDYLKNIYIALKKPNELLKKCNPKDYEKLWAYNLLKEKNKCREILEVIRLEDMPDTKTQLFVQSMMKKYLENEHFYIMFLKETYYPWVLQHGYYEEAKILKDIIVDYLIEDSRYKDAIKILKDFKKMK